MLFNDIIVFNLKHIIMRKLKLFLIGLTVVISSCDSEESNINPKSISFQDKPELTCTFDLRGELNNLTPKPDAVIINWPRWQIGQTIKIKFLEDNIAAQEKVKRIASEWTTYANLKFEYVPKEQYADIRIAFNTGKPGAWSQLGMSSAYGNGNFQNEPSMRLGPLTGNEESIRRTILHEFGHALGLHHETTNPAANIKWNLSEVYAWYNSNNGWSKEDVDRFVLNKANVDDYSDYDPLSIMHYYIPASLTTDGVGVYEQSVLSKIDKESILKWYPFPVRSVIETAERLDIAAYRKSIKSPNSRYSLEFDSGCLFILDNTNNQKIWSAGAPVYKNAMCYFQSNSGEIKIIGSLPNGFFLQEIVWTNKMSKVKDSQLYLQDNGDLELIQNGVVKWSAKKGKI